jgi:hypothetical protein
MYPLSIPFSFFLILILIVILILIDPLAAPGGAFDQIRPNSTKFDLIFNSRRRQSRVTAFKIARTHHEQSEAIRAIPNINYPPSPAPALSTFNVGNWKLDV